MYLCVLVYICTALLGIWFVLLELIYCVKCYCSFMSLSAQCPCAVIVHMSSASLNPCLICTLFSSLTGVVAAVHGPILNQDNQQGDRNSHWQRWERSQKGLCWTGTMTANAQTQWTLTEYESATTLETWRINLMSILSLEQAFAPYLKRDVIWSRKTKTNPFRGFSGVDARVGPITFKT